MATKTDIELKIVDSVDTSHTEAEVLTDSAANPDAFYVGRGYLAHNGEKVIQGINPNGSYPNMSVGNAQKAKEAESATHADTATDLSGRVEATPEVFTYRPSAGEKSIKDNNAFIRRVKGNSVVFNQLAYSTPITNSNGVIISHNSDDLSVTFTGTATSNFIDVGRVKMVVGHTYLHIVEVMSMGNIDTLRFGNVNEYYSEKTFTSSGIYSRIVPRTHTDTNTTVCLSNVANKDVTGVKARYQVCDLTAMFGAGNEPTTVEEFRALYPDSYYPYNAGELRNLDCSGIKTVGFNQWDEQWEFGYISTKDGLNYNSTTCIRSAGYIRCIPNSEYYISDSGIGRTVYFYDIDKKYIGHAGNLFTTPTNCAFIRFFVEYGTNVSTYNNDICINLHHTGWRDGEYEPYKEVTHALPLSQITNGEPLRKAGSVYDEINETEYIRRVGVVDLGSLNWYLSDSNKSIFATVFPYAGAGDNLVATNILCSKYVTLAYYSVYTESIGISINFYSGNTYLSVCDKSFNDAASLKAALSGVLLNYELAEPIVTPIEAPIDFNYYVEDFGTEEALLTEDSAPFSADIVYQFNATDQIRNNTRNIHKLQKSAFTPSGTSAQYIRGDGSYGDRFELTQSKPVNDGEWEKPDESDYYILILQDHIYSKCPEEVSVDHNIQVYITPTNDITKLAEWWAEIPFGPDPPNELVFKNPSNEEAVIRIAGSAMTDGVNVYHLWSSDGGNTIFGDVKWFSY